MVHCAVGAGLAPAHIVAIICIAIGAVISTPLNDRSTPLNDRSTPLNDRSTPLNDRSANIVAMICIAQV